MSDLRELMPDIDIYARGLVHCYVCAPADMPIEEVVALTNYLNPTGIKSRWHKSTENFKTGEENGYACKCEGKDTRHWLMVC